MIRSLWIQILQVQDRQLFHPLLGIDTKEGTGLIDWLIDWWRHRNARSGTPITLEIGVSEQWEHTGAVYLASEIASNSLASLQVLRRHQASYGWLLISCWRPGDPLMAMCFLSCAVCNGWVTKCCPWEDTFQPALVSFTARQSGMYAYKEAFDNWYVHNIIY